jgi:hypothetical protein
MVFGDAAEVTNDSLGVAMYPLLTFLLVGYARREVD